MKMKRYALLVTLFAVLTLVLGGWFATHRPVAAVAPTERAQDGLRGAVKNVTVETFPVVNRFGAWVEGAGGLESATTYTPRGAALTVKRYRPDGALDYRVERRFKDGLLAEETSFGADDQPLYKWLHAYNAKNRLTSLSGYDDRDTLEFKTLYSYDRQGRLVTETSYGTDEQLSYEAEQRYTQGYTRSTVYYAQSQPESRLEEVFDATDHRLSEESYSPSEDLQYRVVYSYTDEGDLLAESAFTADGSAEYRLENSYDEAGKLLTTTEYDADNEPFYRYSYEYNENGDVTKRDSRGVDGSGSTLLYSYLYDAHGNWTERRTSRPVDRFGEDVLEPTDVTRRTLSYYP